MEQVLHRRLPGVGSASSNKSPGVLYSAVQCCAVLCVWPGVAARASRASRLEERRGVASKLPACQEGGQSGKGKTTARRASPPRQP